MNLGTYSLLAFPPVAVIIYFKSLLLGVALFCILLLLLTGIREITVLLIQIRNELINLNKTLSTKKEN